MTDWQYRQQWQQTVMQPAKPSSNKTMDMESAYLVSKQRPSIMCCMDTGQRKECKDCPVSINRNRCRHLPWPLGMDSHSSDALYAPTWVAGFFQKTYLISIQTTCGQTKYKTPNVPRKMCSQYLILCMNVCQQHRYIPILHYICDFMFCFIRLQMYSQLYLFYIYPILFTCHFLWWVR